MMQHFISIVCILLQSNLLIIHDFYRIGGLEFACSSQVREINAKQWILKFVFGASILNTRHLEEILTAQRLGIRIM